MKLSEVAAKLGCQLEGFPETEVTGVAGIEAAGPGEITFLANRRYFALLKTTRAAAVLVQTDLEWERAAGLPPLAALRSPNPYLAFAKAIELFYEPPRYAPGIHPTAVVAASAKIGPRAHIGPYCVVGERVELGSDAVLHSFVTLYEGVKVGDGFLAHSHVVVREFCKLGDRVILQSGVVLGADGFGFAKQGDGRWSKIVQSGRVVIEDDVEIQANSCVDRGTIGETRIGRGSKLDALVLVGHASEIGTDTLLCGQVGLAGSTKVGNSCILAGQVGTAGHLTIGDGAVVNSQSGVPNDVSPGAQVAGTPAVEVRQWRKNAAALNRLPSLQTKVRELEAEIAKLRQK